MPGTGVVATITPGEGMFTATFTAAQIQSVISDETETLTIKCEEEAKEYANLAVSGTFEGLEFATFAIEQKAFGNDIIIVYEMNTAGNYAHTEGDVVVTIGDTVYNAEDLFEEEEATGTPGKFRLTVYADNIAAFDTPITITINTSQFN